jgi:transglutaminase-like putative cysteine protease
MAAVSSALAQVPLNLVRQQSTLQDSARSTAQTARVMCEHIRRDSHSPVVISTARRICQAARCQSASDAARAVWLFVKQRVRFVHDDDLITRLFGERDQLELLIAPSALLHMNNPEGDCDDFTMLTCALLAALGVRSQVVCICCDLDDPARFSHVYPRAYLPEVNSWMAVDSSHGSHPGWKVPARHTFREQRYDLNGNCAADLKGGAR